MITFTTALVLLVLGYAVYGAFVERVFGADASRKTPCYTMADGVDYTPMPTWKVYLIQFLNIAGTGPIFGAILGILYGPAAYLWIVFGCIFGGAVHDYLSGMISLRKNGASLPEVVGDELGAGIRLVMRVFSLILMVLVGTVFVTTPAGLLASMTGDWGVWGSALFWSVVIFVYYVLATLLPIDTLIGRIYPLFGVALLFMAVGVLVGIFTHDGWMPEITSAFESHHPDRNLSIFPMLFITIACGKTQPRHCGQCHLPGLVGDGGSRVGDTRRGGGPHYFGRYGIPVRTSDSSRFPALPAELHIAPLGHFIAPVCHRRSVNEYQLRYIVALFCVV